MATKRGRVSLTDTVNANADSMKMYSLFAPKPVSEEGKRLAERMEVIEKKPRRDTRGDGVPYESAVQAEIIEYLQSRNDIGALVRVNSGTMQIDDRFVRFNLCFGKQDGLYMVKLDLEFIYIPTGQHCEVEVKRSTWRRPTDERERKQEARINHIRLCNGIAFFATSVDDVKRGLPPCSE